MSYGNYLCSKLIDELNKDSSFSKKDLELVLSYENYIKPVPLDKVIMAFSVKECHFGDRVIEKLNTGEEIVTNNHKVKLTLGVNIYIPYFYKEKKGVDFFEDMFDSLLKKHINEISSATCHETNYVRESQALVTKSELVFDLIHIYNPPVVV